MPGRAINQDIDVALTETERSGLSIVLTIRSVLILIVIAGILIPQGLTRGAFGAMIASIFLFIGIAYHVVLLRRRDRIWMRYLFMTLGRDQIPKPAAARLTSPGSAHPATRHRRG